MRYILMILLALPLFTQPAYAWDNPNKQVVVGKEALKTKMIGAFMDGFNDGSRHEQEDETYINGDSSDFQPYYMQGYYSGFYYAYTRK